MPDAVQPVAPPTIWDALAKWAVTLKKWQRMTLSLTVKHGPLSDEQIGLVYDLFLAEAGLTHTSLAAPDTPLIVAPTLDGASADIQLTRIDALEGINALPTNAALTFGPKLTVVYGRSGAGKSGFARIFANACFCRNTPEIIQNIYDEKAATSASARFHLKVGGQEIPPIAYPAGDGIDKLKCIAVFDRVVAERHVSTTMTFEFKPSGFDAFPEMARIYGRISDRLQEAVNQRSTENTFSKSFLGDTTEVSERIATLEVNTDRAILRKLSVYGDAEKARFVTVESQLQSLRSASSKEAIASLQKSHSAIEELFTKLAAAADKFNGENRQKRNDLAETARKASASLAAASIDQFKRAFFTAVGSPEWESFTAAARVLGRTEHPHYPDAAAHCLLCERPLDAQSKQHIEALFAFIESEAQKDAETADEAAEQEIANVGAIDFSMFLSGSVVREAVKKFQPDLEADIAAWIAKLELVRDGAAEALKASIPFEGTAGHTKTTEKLKSLLNEIDADVERLAKDDQGAAIAELEQERLLLRHREVLSSLYADIEKFLDNAVWCAKADKAKSQFNTKQITDKEKELFGEVLGDTYREKLTKECTVLDCEVPIEMRTQGKGGETVRALTLKGGHKPDRILSEGEQKALALADFLTEIGLNPNSGGIILDDPVSSQDHQRKELIAHRLVEEAAHRQVIIFTHDLVFLNQLVGAAEKSGTAIEKHRIDRHADGKPGQVKLGDVPAISKDYDTTHQAGLFLAQAKKESGTARDHAIREGFGALRRTVEEIIPKFLLKGVVPRWNDRVIVGGLNKVAWDDGLADDIVGMFEELSKHIEGHTHTEEAMGAPPEVKDLEKAIARVTDLVRRAREERKKPNKASS